MGATDNGHLNDAFYFLIFSRAGDAVLDLIGMGDGYRRQHGVSVFTLETHVCYLREVGVGETVEVEARVLDLDAKRLHLFQTLRRAGEAVSGGDRRDGLAQRRHDDPARRAVPARDPRAARGAAGARGRPSPGPSGPAGRWGSAVARRREAARREAAPVVRRQAEAAERRAVLGRAVAGVALPAVAGIAGGEAAHEAVARDLGHDRGGADRGDERVAADDAAGRQVKPGGWLPSTRSARGRTGRRATARRIARRVARRMLSRSISSTDAAPTATMARSASAAASASRRAGERSLEFVMPSTGSGRITAAARTGPASGPRPTSSTPATGSDGERPSSAARPPPVKPASRPPAGFRRPPRR